MGSRYNCHMKCGISHGMRWCHARLRTLVPLLVMGAVGTATACTDNAPAMDLTMRTASATAVEDVMSDSVDAATGRPGPKAWTWEPIITKGHLVGIDERYERGLIRVVRLYAFDTTGILRHYREWRLRGDSLAPWPTITAAGIDSAVMADAPVDATTVEFLAGVPMYSVRRTGRLTVPFHRVEMRRIVARAHTLYSRAAGATASR